LELRRLFNESSCSYIKEEEEEEDDDDNNNNGHYLEVHAEKETRVLE
jgi:hypothetical protein